ncbi:MAG: M48 family metalloprotease [Planctomycetes bacterium]|nr:M48 family metalloprotease [Planctomycetota bacterium]
MIQKILIALALLAILWLVLFPRRIPGLFRRAGRRVGELGTLGKELATGEEAEDSPLARYELRAGEIVAARLLARHALAGDAGLQASVAGLGARLAQHALRRQVLYRFSVLQSDEPNAFAVPGGSVFITSGMVELCGEEPQRIAGVLAHEIVHIDRCHAVRSLAASMAVRAGFHVLSLGRGAILARLAGGIEALLTQGYAQDRELEADLLGARLARLAGYDPRGLIDVLERVRALAPDGRGPLAQVLQYFRSHPPVDLRIARLRAEVG